MRPWLVPNPVDVHAAELLANEKFEFLDLDWPARAPFAESPHVSVGDN